MQEKNTWNTAFEADIQGIRFSCSDYSEIGQGGPCVGRLMRNGALVLTGCCGPFIYADGYLYASVMEHRLLGYMEKGDFRICRLDVLDNCRIEYLGIPRRYVELVELCGNRLFHYCTMKKDVLLYTDIKGPEKSSETDTPFNFRTVISGKGIRVEYVLTEQLSGMDIPVRNMKINEYVLPEYTFGAPFLFNESMLIVPVFKEKFRKTGFNLARIDLSNYRIHVFPVFRKMFYLESFRNDTVYYYDSMSKSELLCYSF